MCYDETVLRGAITHGLYNGNRLFTTMGAVLEHVCTMLFHGEANMFDALRVVKIPGFRDLAALQDAGYSLRSKVGDPFTAREVKITKDALTRCEGRRLSIAVIHSSTFSRVRLQVCGQS